MLIKNIRRIATTALFWSAFHGVYAQQNIADYSLLDNEIKNISTENANSTLEYLTDKDVKTIFVVSPFSANTTVLFESERPLVLKGYSLTSGDDDSCDPRNFRIEGSNDKETWSRIGATSYGYTFNRRYVASSISINANTTAYKFFRIVFISINGGSQLKVADMQLFGYPATLDADLTQTQGREISGQYAGNSSDPLSNLLDNNLSNSFAQNGVKNAWIQIELPMAEKISSYALIPATDTRQANAPRVWNLQASNDGEEWDVLDIRSNKTFFEVTNNFQRYSLSVPSREYDWAQCADYAQEKMIDLFWANYGGGKYLTHSYHPNTDSINRGFNYWWMAHTIDVFVDAFARTQNSSYRLKIDNVYNAMLSYGNGSLKNGFFDDMEWMGLACLRTQKQITSSTKWKDSAVQLWDWIKLGWNDNYGGGIQWVDVQPSSKNACSNAPAIILAARLYSETGEQQYLDWAVKIFDWMNDALIFPENGLVKDSYTQNNYGWTFTYNQGTWIGACLELYKITNDQKYYDIAMRTADFVVSDRDKFSPYGILYNNEGGGNNNLNGTGDGGLFKGIFMRYLSQWVLSGKLDEEREQRFVSYFIENGKSLWDTALSNDTHIFNDRWYERRVPIAMDDIKKRGYDASTHLSATMLFELLDELDRNGFLPANNQHPSAVANADKAYKYFRLNIEGNNGGSNLELSRWQLFTDKGNSIEIPTLDNLGVKISSINQVLTLENQANESFKYFISDLQGRVLSRGVLFDSFSLSVQKGGYIVVVDSNDGRRLSQKIVVE